MELDKQQDKWINENAFKNGFEITPSESINWVHWFNLESWSKENAIWLLCQINPHEPLENIPVTIKEISDQCPNSDKTPYEWMSLFDEFGIFELYASKAMKEHFALSTEIISNSCSIDQNKHNQEYSRTSINKERELTAWLRETWIKEKRPGGTAFFRLLKKYENKIGSPITNHHSASKDAGFSWKTSTGRTGSMSKKTVQTKVSIFKNNP